MREHRGQNPVRILMVDDDEVDVIAVRRAFRKMGVEKPMRVVGDGIEALGVLRGDGERGPLPRPYLILLDLNMPRMGGLEFLQELRSDPALRAAPVFVLTSSLDREQKLRAYDYNVAGYVVKSRMAEDFVKLASMLETYCHTVEMP